MKSFKRIVLLILFVLTAVCAAVEFSACGNSGGGASVNYSSEKRYNESITYKLSYASEEECPDGNIKEDNLHPFVDVEVNRAYFMVVDFTISSFNVSGWDEHFNTVIKITPSSTVEARLEEAATGTIEEKAEGGGKSIKATFKVPEDRSNERTYRIIIKLLYHQIENYTTSFAVYGDNQNNYEFSEKFIIIKPTDGLSFELNGDGLSYAVYGGTSSGNEIIIPEFYNGLPVITIGQAAFKGYSELTNITIPDSVTSIRMNAFRGCINLTRVTIGDGVTDIGWEAFYGCSGLTSITIPNGMTFIDGGVFRGCSGLTSISIPDSVKSIEEAAFYGCSGLTSISIPDSVTNIGHFAFEDCISVTRITIGNSVTSIGNGAFSDCKGLRSIILPISVKSIGFCAFDGCSPRVYYRGTEEELNLIDIEWGGVVFEKGYRHSYLYYYSETKPTESGKYWHYVNGEPVVW